jgi:hypothetical protein
LHTDESATTYISHRGIADISPIAEWSRPLHMTCQLSLGKSLTQLRSADS